MPDSLLKKVTEIIAERKKISADEITIETTFGDLGVDSLEALSLIYDFEDAFNVEIPNEEAVNIQKVGDIVESLKRLGASAQP